MNIDKKQLKIAKNYADALLKIAKEQDSAEKIYNDLISVLEVLKSSDDLKLFLENPLVSPNDKKEIIYKVFNKDFDLQIINFLNTLVDNKRIKILDTIFYCYEKGYEQAKNTARVSITSAVEINPESKNRLIETLAKKLGKQIIAEYQINNDIIGGLVIKIQDKVVDLSIKSKIKDMEKQLR